MSDKLKSSDIAEDGVLDPLIEDTKKLIKLLDKLAASFVEVGKEAQKVSEETGFDTFENIEKTKKAIDDVKKATKGLDKVEKEREKLQQRQKDLEDERIKQNFKLRAEINKRSKELRDEAKATIESENAYLRLRKARNDAQKELKTAIATFGALSKEAKNQQKVFDELNDEFEQIEKSAKDGRSFVGRYREQLEGLKIGGFEASSGLDAIDAAAKAFVANPIIAVVTLLAAALAGLFKAFQRSEKGAVLLRKGAALLEASFSILVDFVNDATEAFLSFVDDPIGGLKKLGKAIVDNLLNRFEALINIFKLAGDAIKALTKGDFEKLGEIAKQAADEFLTLQTGVDDFIDKAGELTDKINDTANAFLQLEAAQRAVRTQNRQLNLEIAQQAEALELLTAQAEDDGRSLQEQRQAILEAGEAREQVAKRQRQIAQNNLDVLNLEVQIRRKNGEEIQDLLDQRNEAEIAFLDASREATLSQFENAARERLILLDIFDQELDDLIDFADNSKTIREQIAADDKASFELRQQALDAATNDLNNSFKSQIDLFNETVNALKKSRGEAEDFTLPIDELLAIQDATELNETIQALGLVERQRIRLLELIRERRTATNDLTTVQRDLTAAEKESLEIENDIFSQERALAQLRAENADAEAIFARLDRDRAEDEIEFLRMRIKEAAEGSAERFRLQQELNNKLLDEEKKRLTEEQKARDDAAKEAEEKEKKRSEEQIKRREATFDALNDLNQSFFEKQQERIDEELSASEKREDQLRQAAALGAQDAEKNLKAEEQRQQELEAEKAKRLKQQKLAELGLAAVESYAAKVASDDPNPLPSTIADISKLVAFVGALQPFYYGTEDTGNAGSLADKYGKITGYTHENERVLPADLNAMIPKGMSNKELAILANSSTSLNQKADNIEQYRLERLLKEQTQAIKDQPVYLGGDLNIVEKALKWSVKEGNKRKDFTKKIKGIL